MKGSVSAIYSTYGERWSETPDKYFQYLSIILFERYCGDGYPHSHRRLNRGLKT